MTVTKSSRLSRKSARNKKLYDLAAKYPWIAVDGGIPIPDTPGEVTPWALHLFLDKEVWCLACKKGYSAADPSNLAKHAQGEKHKNAWALHGSRQRAKLLKIDQTLPPAPMTEEKKKRCRPSPRPTSGTPCGPLSARRT